MSTMLLLLTSDFVECAWCTMFWMIGCGMLFMTTLPWNRKIGWTALLREHPRKRTRLKKRIARMREHHRKRTRFKRCKLESPDQQINLRQEKSRDPKVQWYRLMNWINGWVNQQWTKRGRSFSYLELLTVNKKGIGDDFSVMLAAADFHQVFHSIVETDLSPRLNQVDSYSPEGATFKAQAYISRNQQELPIVLDTGASTSVTPVREDFIEPLQLPATSVLHGLKGEVQVIGYGKVRWTVHDLYGRTRTLQTHAYYVPGAKIRLFSPQVYFQEQKKGHCIIEQNHVTMTLPDSSALTFPYNSGSNIPLMLVKSTPLIVGLTSDDAELLANPALVSTYLTVSDQENQNLTSAQRELLLWHQKLGHANMTWIQELCSKKISRPERPDLPVIDTKAATVPTCVAPLCVACQMAKQTRRGPHSVATKHPGNDGFDMVLKKDNLRPGSMVSIDQYESSIRGRLPNTKGREQLKDRYCGGTIFVDHATGFVFVKHQVSLRAGDTVMSKRAFEAELNTYGVRVEAYHSDNAPFNAAEFRADIEAKGQKLSFSGTGAHHQNGIAERAIRTITSWARAMILHSIVHWPEQADLGLWPFAMEHATYLWNHLPKKVLLWSPIELLAETKFESFKFLNRLHVWGCPVYVLDPALQDGKKVPKWKPRSRRGQFLGFSPRHSTTVGRILNLETGFVSPQYHVVYDDGFTTVASTVPKDLNDATGFTPSQWESLIQDGYERHHCLDDEQPTKPLLADEWLSPHELADRHRLRETRRARIRSLREDQPNQHMHRDRPIHAPTHDAVPQDVPTALDPVADNNDVGPDAEVVQEVDVPANGEPEGLRRSQRIRTQPRRYFGPEFANYQVGADPRQKIRSGWLNDSYLQGLSWNDALQDLRSADLSAYVALDHINFDYDEQTLESMHPMAFSARANAEDNPRWHEAMNGPNRAGYWKAMEVEVDTLYVKKNAWVEVQRQSWMNVLPSTWAFRCKRFPDGLIRKLKARFCVRGDKQLEGIDYFDTYAPVVSWATVRLMLVLSIILGLATKQVDYTAAFVHADIDRDPNWENMTEEEREKSGVYIEMPKGFSKPGTVLKLQKSLYGLKQAPRNFFLHLKSKLESIGFRSLYDVDPCLFVTDTVICLVYVDDTLFYSPKEEYINQVIQQLRDADMELEVEGEVAGFLGVHIKRDAVDGSILLSQAGLVKRIVDAIGVAHLPTKSTPTTGIPLVKDTDGDPATGTFNYRSVIGMLQYLQNHSRPDITFAVSQCARFVHNPRRSHEVALEHLGQYLKGTMEHGLVFRPVSTLNIECFVDADFAGLWPHEDKLDEICVKSRTGFVICLSNCPVIWASKLQGSIATSTMEAEYIALSTAMREVLPFQALVKAVAIIVGYSDLESTTMRTTVWEDNTGARTLANLEPGRVTPRSKFYAVKFHWFRSKLKPNDITVEQVDTADQKADMFTKGLRREKFCHNRGILCGW